MDSMIHQNNPKKSQDKIASDFQKIQILMRGMQESEWNRFSELSKEQIQFFLDKKTLKGKFNPELAKKFFSINNINDSRKITSEDFIKAFLHFENDLEKNKNEFKKRLKIEKSLLDSYNIQMDNYLKKNCNKEGISENAMIIVQITDINLKKRLEGIDSISIEIVYNDKSKTTTFKTGKLYTSSNEKFCFKPVSRRDKFEFIMKGINDRGQEFIIGNKVFPLNDITSQEEYQAQIIVPDIENEEEVAAFINSKITLIWNNLKFIDDKRKNAQKRVIQLEDAIDKLDGYLEDINQIYGVNTHNFQVNFYNEFKI